MILTGSKIISEHRAGKIIIQPFDIKQTNPNSYDFRLGNKVMVYREKVLDTKVKNETEIITIPQNGLVLEPGRLYLGHTAEVMGSEYYVPIIRGRSSTGRLGLFVHITADLIDIGSVNQWTLQMHAVQPVRVYPGMLIGQVTFWQPTGKIRIYDGKYQGSRGPVASQIYKDFL